MRGAVGQPLYQPVRGPQSGRERISSAPIHESDARRDHVCDARSVRHRQPIRGGAMRRVRTIILMSVVFVLLSAVSQQPAYSTIISGSFSLDTSALPSSPL